MMKHIHLIGIGGTGLSAIALLLKERGYTVSGSDRIPSRLTQQLVDQGIQVFIGHKAENISGADLIVRSSAVPLDNPEVVAATAAGISVLKRAEFLGELTAGSITVAIAGTHGKTTTTAMIAWALTQAGHDPSFIIGGVSKNMGVNAHAGSGSVFIIEADEYDHMFLGLAPNLAVITNLDYDHPDCFPTEEIYRDAFKQFAQKIKPDGTLLVCSDNPGADWLVASAILDQVYTLTYGIDHPACYQAQGLKTNPIGGTDFEVVYQPKDESPLPLVTISLPIPGKHNVYNALAAVSAIHQLGFSVSASALALLEYQGTGRRFDLRGIANGVAVIDDYAHHPTEIQATLAAARQRYPTQTIWTVWQPHTFTRLKTFSSQFSGAFSDADHVIVTDVYGAREESGNFSANQLVDEMRHPSVNFIPKLTTVSSYLLQNLTKGDVLIVLSAGDADQVSTTVLEGLKAREATHV